ncbi:hypothetical protein QUF70_20085 [Desulfobacterales bacterium HSG17]|nr:hypothetical protein [Desulfobacterales bacterium HSG17]
MSDQEITLSIENAGPKLKNLKLKGFPTSDNPTTDPERIKSILSSASEGKRWIGSNWELRKKNDRQFVLKLKK